jgi:hypothetical protein
MRSLMRRSVQKRPPAVGQALAFRSQWLGCFAASGAVFWLSAFVARHERVRGVWAKAGAGAMPATFYMDD